MVFSEKPLQKLGVWVNDRPAMGWRPERALFLDRDGTLIKDTGYPSKAKDVHLLPGAAELILAARRLGFAVVIVTNQSGIARGYFGWPEYDIVHAEFVAQLRSFGAEIDLALACPFHEDGNPPYNVANHPMRKPNPGMLLHAARMLGLDLGQSIMAGDKAIDVEAGRMAGVFRSILVDQNSSEPPRPFEVLLTPSPSPRSSFETLTVSRWV